MGLSRSDARWYGGDFVCFRKNTGPVLHYSKTDCQLLHFPSCASEHSWMSSNAEKKRRDKVADILSKILVSLCNVLPLPVMYLTDIRGHTCIPFPQVFPLTLCMPEPWLCAGSRAILLPWMRPPDILFILFYFGEWLVDCWNPTWFF